MTTVSTSCRRYPLRRRRSLTQQPSSVRVLATSAAAVAPESARGAVLERAGDTRAQRQSPRQQPRHNGQDHGRGSSCLDEGYARPGEAADKQRRGSSPLHAGRAGHKRRARRGVHRDNHLRMPSSLAGIARAAGCRGGFAVGPKPVRRGSGRRRNNGYRRRSSGGRRSRRRSTAISVERNPKRKHQAFTTPEAGSPRLRSSNVTGDLCSASSKPGAARHSRPGIARTLAKYRRKFAVTVPPRASSTRY